MGIGGEGKDSKFSIDITALGDLVPTVIEVDGDDYKVLDPPQINRDLAQDLRRLADLVDLGAPVEVECCDIEYTQIREIKVSIPHRYWKTRRG